MKGRWPDTDGPASHNLGHAVHFLFDFRSIPSGTEILHSHGFIEKFQGFPVHVEQVPKDRIGAQMVHVGENTKVQQRISVAEIAQINPIYLALSNDDVAGVDISMQAGGDGFKFVYVAKKPGLDMIRNVFAGCYQTPCA